ncbi:helix-turn-helix domain-containing protein [Hoeflea marina]|nr:AraC family transcriptional regulator [Hoeflea marina]
MTFQPRMNNDIRGFSVIGDLHRRSWNGIVADVWSVDCAPSAGGRYISADPRLFVMLEARGGRNCNIRISPKDIGTVQDYSRQAISYVPAEMELWAEALDIEFARHLDVHFNVDHLGARLQQDLDARRLSTPRLMFSDPRLLGLAHLIAAECANPQPLHDLYGDGLAVALFIDLMQLAPPPPRRRGGLAGWQLRRATGHIEEHCLRNIRLGELAALAGLSPSHFSHAFKASTGMAPHQWQMQARIERAKTMLMKADLPLTGIAAETGFSDQAHFTRVFRKTVGTTPANWKKSRTD